MNKTLVLSISFFLIGFNSFAQWDLLTSGTSQSLNSVYFTNSTIGYAVGASGTIMKTTDGGAIWNSQVSGTTQIFNSVYFINSTTGYAVGASGTIMKTTDGGITWTNVYLGGGSSQYYSLFFTDINTGYVVGSIDWGNQGIILKTTDGGTTWNVSVTGIPLYSVYFVGSNI